MNADSAGRFPLQSDDSAVTFNVVPDVFVNTSITSERLSHFLLRVVLQIQRQ